jgi:3-phenylpropionate/trans-cinnamate dioxygenase ferredoxin reductase subunit
MTDPRRFVIVGAGQAGRSVVLALRANGFAGSITWIGSEAHRPYERPPLSKAVLQGQAGLPDLMLIRDEAWDDLALDWRPACSVTGIDRAARTVLTDAGETIAYDTLFLATGGRARVLPGLASHPRVHALRSWEDACALQAGINAAQSLLVLGGGWIGLEVAASARKLGKAVTVIEAAPRLAARTMPSCISALLQSRHESHGVDLHLGAVVQQVLPDDAGVTLRLGNGATLRGDQLLLGIGLQPDDGLGARAGLQCDNGIWTDAQGRTSDPHIFACGDVANALQPGGAARMRMESWDNAQRTAVAAAKAALDVAHDAAAEGPPWFWSDQYDCNLQVLGLPAEGDEVVERQDDARGQRLYFFYRGAAIHALAAVNAGREIKLVRKWIREQRFPSRAALADPGTDLNRIERQEIAA